jgi:hypothetical protein
MPREKGKRPRQTGSDALENGRDRIKRELQKRQWESIRKGRERNIQISQADYWRVASS